METLLPHVKPQSLSSFPLIPQGKKPSISSLLPSHKISSSYNYGYCMKLLQQQPLPWPKAQLSMVTKCCKGGGVISEVEDEMMLEEELMQIGMGKLKEKCKESNGIAELLECLEREAIMGEDEGKEPTDYNRRAHIFDKSSRVFQALKERERDSN